MNAKNIESERLYYKPLSLNHLSKTYVNWLNDPEVNRYLETKGNYSLDLLKSFLEEQEKNDILFWAIHIKDSDKHIGNIKIDPIDADNNSGEYGFMIGDKDEWGKGYGKEASLKIIRYCFEQLKLSSITLGVIEDNFVAVEMYKKIGFEPYQIKENVGFYNGKFCNEFRMILTNSHAT